MKYRDDYKDTNIDEKCNEIEIDECPICMSSITHSTLNCVCCNKRICLDCLILLKDKREGILSSDDGAYIYNYEIEKNYNNINVDETNEGVAQPVLIYKCPMCRTENTKYLTQFDNKYDFIKLMTGDYIKHKNDLKRLNDICLRYLPIQVNSKEYNKAVEERDRYKNALTKFDNMMTSSKKQLYMEQIEHNKLKINHNELLNKYNALLQDVEFIKCMNRFNKDFTENIHKIVNKSKPSKLKTDLNTYLKSTVSFDIKFK